jgi:alginate O-acetyltransferase complex protein AlgI
MIFTDLNFLLFFSVVLLVANIVLKNKNRPRVLFLTLASYFFYCAWDYRFSTLILFSTIVDYFLGLKISSVEGKERKKFYLSLSLLANIGLLGFFKYFNFFLDNINAIAGSEFSTWNIILPVGISFYTFQTMSYTIDIYRRKISPEKDFLKFAFFVSFFPQLVAGPIVRAAEFLPQSQVLPEINKSRALAGFQIFLYGVIKKALIADTLAQFVDPVFSSPENFSSLTIWLGVIAYSIQIFTDFSGYSDMAIGVAHMLGYDLVKNFNRPYVSHSITEFWRRWHMSLSFWIRDYIYISLGGNRLGRFRTYINLLVTMLLGGLWHGASWSFVIWGGLHGVALAIERFFGLDNRAYSNRGKVLPWIVTMLFVANAWVFFRAQDLTVATEVFRRAHVPATHHFGSSYW